MFLWTLRAHAAALTRDPNNAALLYYQALLLRPEPNEATFFEIRGVRQGLDPNEHLRQYLNLQSCQKTIKLALAATKIPRCNWGFSYSYGHGISTDVSLQLHQLSGLLEVYARTLAADGKYREAPEMCLGMCQLAVRIGDDTYFMFYRSHFVDTRARICIQHILGSMPLDVDTLTWLQGKLATGQGTRWRPAKALKNFRDMQCSF